MGTKRFLPADAYTIGLIYVKSLEMDAISVMLDEEYESVPLAQGETNALFAGLKMTAAEYVCSGHVDMFW